MRAIILCLIAVSLGYGNIRDKLDRMETQQTSEVKGFVLRQKVMPLIPPEELFEDTQVTLTPPDVLFGTAQPDYMGKINELSTRLTAMENNLSQLTDLVGNVQEISISNKEFTLKLVELLLAALFGGSGLISVLLSRKKK